MGCARIPGDDPTIMYDGELIMVADRNADKKCREVLETFYEVLGTN